MAKKLSISFKETTKDIELYIYLSNLEDRSTEMKNLIRKGLEYKENEKKPILKNE